MQLSGILLFLTISADSLSLFTTLRTAYETERIWLSFTYIDVYEHAKIEFVQETQHAQQTTFRTAPNQNIEPTGVLID